MPHSLKVFAILGMVFMPLATMSQEAPEASESFTLQWPLNCAVFENCFIQSYPDLRAGTNRAVPLDYKCGQRTKPGLVGTSIVFKDHSTTLNRAVLAMAPGRVMFSRDDLSDSRRYGLRSRKACGNYVQVRHSSTYSTKYCHLREGTVGVEVGERVDAGTQLGQVGSSGATEAPKLEVRVLKNGTPVDPFTSRDLSAPSECFSKSDKQLWAEEIPYPDAGVMAASFTLGAPPAHAIAFNAEVTESLPAEVSPISAWVRVFGVKKGDREKIVIKNPAGEVWHENKRFHPIAANFWTAMATARPTAPLEPGVWQGVYTLKRSGEEILRHTFEVKIN